MQPHGATDRFERAYRHLLAETREVLPNTALVLCEPFILNVGARAANWPEWKAKLDYYSEVVRGLSKEFNTVFRPLQSVFR